MVSSTQPSSTKIGTDTSTRLDMPSSMRPTTTPSGTCVLKRMKQMVPRPKQKAMGTPATSSRPTMPIRKMTMLSVPSERRKGACHHSAAPSTATRASAAPRCLRRQVRQAWPRVTPSITTRPVKIAATR